MWVNLIRHACGVPPPGPAGPLFGENYPGPAGPSSLKTGHWPVFRALRTHRTVFRALTTPMGKAFGGPAAPGKMSCERFSAKYGPAGSGGVG